MLCRGWITDLGGLTLRFVKHIIAFLNYVIGKLLAVHRVNLILAVLVIWLSGIKWKNESCVFFNSNLVSMTFGHGRVCSSHFRDQGEGTAPAQWKVPWSWRNAQHVLFSLVTDRHFHTMPCRCHHCHFSQSKVPASQWAEGRPNFATPFDFQGTRIICCPYLCTTKIAKF